MIEWMDNILGENKMNKERNIEETLQKTAYHCKDNNACLSVPYQTTKTIKFCPLAVYQPALQTGSVKEFNEKQQSICDKIQSDKFVTLGRDYCASKCLFNKK